jgi:hypothetical protein
MPETFKPVDHPNFTLSHQGYIENGISYPVFPKQNLEGVLVSFPYSSLHSNDKTPVAVLLLWLKCSFKIKTLCHPSDKAIRKSFSWGHLHSVLLIRFFPSIC